jgi:hypothetical protein
MPKIMFVCLLALVGFGTGCAHLYQVRVDSINDGTEKNGKTFMVLPGDTQVSASDLQFREYARYVSRALQERGFIPAQEKQTPELEIFLTYGIGNPELRVRNYTVPVWGQTSTQIVTREHTHENQSGHTTVSETEVTPEYGVTGFSSQSEQYSVYPKFITLEAYQVKPDTQIGQPLEITWKVTLRAEGKRNDLRHAFPVMVAASVPYLGGNTGGEVEVRLTRDQLEVRRILGSDKVRK